MKAAIVYIETSKWGTEILKTPLKRWVSNSFWSKIFIFITFFSLKNVTVDWYRSRLKAMLKEKMTICIMWKNRWDRNHFVLQHQEIETIVKWIFQAHWITHQIMWVHMHLVAWQSKWIHWISHNIFFIGCPIDIPFITITITNRNAFQIKVLIKLLLDRSTILITCSKSQFPKDSLEFKTQNIFKNHKMLCNHGKHNELRTLPLIKF